ncbi:MAG: hypothetical protein LCH54_03395 [Bacteroidetes bacterium]|nr:hypothetical protein [Bacteroidota bacterium]
MISKLLIRRLGVALPFLMIANFALAQQGITHSIVVTSPAMDKIRFSDLMKFDPRSTGGTSRMMLRMTLENSGEDYTIPVGEILFEVQYNTKSLGLTLFNNKPVTVKKGFPIVLTNVNAMKSDGVFGFKVKGGDINMDDVVSALLGGSKDITDINPQAPIPAGEYKFLFTVLGNTQSDEMILSNPSGYVSLIGPGTTFLDEEPGEIFDAKPAISWSGDAPEFEWRIVVVDPTVDKTMGDLLSKTPQASDITKNKFVRYPNSDLQAGKVYAVLVSSRVNSLGSSKPEENWATPFWFTIPQAKSASEVAGNNIINQLKAIFGDDYAAIFEQIKSGKVKGTIMIDGKSVTFQELAIILQKLQTGDANLESFDVK